MSRWLVTGGCGFIGSHLVEALLARGDGVRVLDNLSSGKKSNIPADAEFLEGDVADPSSVAEALDGMHGVFHLAAVASVERCQDDWLECHRTNLSGTINVLEKSRRGGSKPSLPIVYASSAAVYGDNDQLPLIESANARPLSAYGADKLGGEVHARVAWSVHGIPNVGLRFFNVYGPRQDPASPYSGVIAIFADRIARDQEIEIFGDGQHTRDFIFVTDVVAHLLAAMTDLRSGARVFNVCTGRRVSVLELAQVIARVAGRTPRIRHSPPRRGDIRASVGDPTAARSAFGLVANTTFLDGVRKTLDFMKASGLS
jgi:UDP-glucose 4-epimerase